MCTYTMCDDAPSIVPDDVYIHDHTCVMHDVYMTMQCVCTRRALYDLLDATGQMCWDENRDYGAKYGSGVYAIAMRDMVKRDRNHASVIMWR